MTKSKAMTKSNKPHTLSEERLRNLCGLYAKRYFPSSPLLQEEAYDEAYCLGMRQRAEGVREDWIVRRIKSSVINVFDQVGGRDRRDRNKNPKSDPEYAAGWKMFYVHAKPLVCISKTGESYDNPCLPKQSCQYTPVDNRDLAEKLLTRLNPNRENLVRLHFLEGKTVPEIAAERKLTQSTVRQTIALALVQLRNLPEMQEMMK